MNENLQAAILFLLIFAACMTCYKIGSMDGRDKERRKRQRIQATQNAIREQSFTRR